MKTGNIRALQELLGHNLGTALSERTGLRLAVFLAEAASGIEIRFILRSVRRENEYLEN
jgi:hypothetical protein